MSGAVACVVSQSDFDHLSDHSVKGAKVVPAVLALEWFSRLAMRLVPGFFVSQCCDFRVLKGIVLSGENPKLADYEIVYEGVTEEESIIFTMELNSLSKQTHYRVNIIMCPQLTDKKNVIEASEPTGECYQIGTREEFYPRYLFHGPEYQVLSHVNTLSEDGGRALLKSTRALGNRSNKWVTDSSAFEAALQLLAIWTRERLQKSGLPTGIKNIEIYSNEAGSKPDQITMKARVLNSSQSNADVWIFDSEKRLLVFLEGIEMTGLPWSYAKNDSV